MIPEILGQASALNQLILSENFLTGNLPTAFGLLCELQILYLDNNYFSGTIPSEFDALTGLKEVLFHNNSKLTGSISLDLCQLSAAFLLELISIDCESVMCDCNCACAENVPGER